jgi:hypothetical protein
MKILQLTQVMGQKQCVINVLKHCDIVKSTEIQKAEENPWSLSNAAAKVGRIRIF